jgi:hypothetical protein
MKVISVLASVALVALTAAQLKNSQLVGDWEGESKCVNLKVSPACKDEHVIYHITPVVSDKGHVYVRADKVVGGKPLVMGYLTFTIDAKTSSIRNEFTLRKSHGIWKLSVKGKEMTGTLTKLPENVVVRQVTLHFRKKGKA